MEQTMQKPEVTSTATTVETKPQETQPEKQPDLITRVSQFKKEEKPQEIQDTFGLTKDDFDKVQNDPVLSKFYKSMQADYTRKTQAVAGDKKEIERLKTEVSTWTPERIQQLLNDPNFVNAAQVVMKSQAPTTFEGTQEEWSVLSETDKNRFRQMEQRLTTMEQQNYQVRKMQEDEILKNKYTNYDPRAIDTLTADMLAQKVQATREHLWMVLDYPNAVERAYNLGLQDGKSGITEKVSSSSIEGTMATSTKEPPKKEEGESDRNYFRRLFLLNVARQKETNIKK